MAPDADIAPGNTWVNSYSDDSDVKNGRLDSLLKWNIGTLINQDRSIREKLSLFWHNHFATETITVEEPHTLYKHYSLLRTSALGNFKDLVRAVSIDPAMLIYLNGQLSSKTAPDENYARELQELFTLGKTNNPNYTEDDVKAASRVLTGWRIDYPPLRLHLRLTNTIPAANNFPPFMVAPA